ncbi:ribose import ATP-binding protein RbsA [Spirochaetia bacterium]|nr:ribose import ATP-binding protein RbsA [Spirochaetia bacterium]
METVLEMKNINKSFSGVQVLNDVHFDLRKGEVHALVGENGAGKSTLIKILAGVHRMDKGSVSVFGKDVQVDNVYESQSLGISVIHQELSLVPTMTVAENVFLGRMPQTKIGLINDKKMIEDVKVLFQRFGIDNIDAGAKTNKLSVAQQQMIEILRALSTNCKILVMDEPTASLTEKEIVKLFEFIKGLQEKEVSVLYISHRMEEIFQISDRITVLRDGRFISTRNTFETNYEDLVSMMVGREFKNVYSSVTVKPGEEILKVTSLNRGNQVQNVSFSLRRGEVLGFYGLIGSGRTETMRVIFGVDKPESGQMFLEGREISLKNIRVVKDIIKQGIVLVPEDRKRQGLIPIQGIRYNVSLAIMDRIIKGINVNRNQEDAIVNEYVTALNIHAFNNEQLTGTLSGGNQQKVVISKCLATKPKIVILDEPTRGIDIGAKHELYKLITKLADEGVAVIFVSSELPEIIHLSTRVIVMHEGRITGELSGNELTEENVIKLALGGESGGRS